MQLQMNYVVKIIAGTLRLSYRISLIRAPVRRDIRYLQSIVTNPFFARDKNAPSCGVVKAARESCQSVREKLPVFPHSFPDRLKRYRRRSYTETCISHVYVALFFRYASGKLIARIIENFLLLI